MILFVSQYFRPEPNIVISDIADEFAERGEEVVVITSHPNYPLGKYYPSVRSVWPAAERSKNLTIWRLPTYPCKSNSKFGRFFSYASFAAMAFICSLFVVRKCRLAFVYQTPFTSALSVLWLKWFCGTRLAYIAVDLWPESFTAAGVAPPKLIMNFLYFYSKIINRAADHIFASTQGTRQRYIEDGIPAANVSFTPVWVNGIPDALSIKNSSDHPKPFRLVYAGNMGLPQRLETLLKAMHELQPEGGFHLDFYGAGVTEATLRELATQLGLTSVSFHGLVSPAEAFQHCWEADAAILHLAASDQFRFTIPSKLVSMLASGSLVICGVVGETSDMLRNAGAGLLFKPENAGDLAQTLRQAKTLSLAQRDDIRQKGLDLYNSTFNKRDNLAKYLSFSGLL